MNSFWCDLQSPTIPIWANYRKLWLIIRILIRQNIKTLQSRDVNVNTQLTVASPVETNDDVTVTGILHYEATVIDPKIGQDQYTEVIIIPKHHLNNVYAT